MTRDEILGLKIGDILSNTMDIEAFTGLKKLKPNAKFGMPRKVTEITAQTVSKVTGKAYVCGYTEHGPNSSISFSIGEDEVVYRLENR